MEFLSQNASVEKSSSTFDARLVITITSGLGALVSGVVLVILLLTKSYKTFLQRLFMWIILSIVIVELCRTASIGYQYHDMDAYASNNTTLQDRLCELTGFVSLWFDWCAYIFCSVLIAYLLFLVCKQTRGDSSTPAKLGGSKFSPAILELAVVAGGLLGPVVVLWVPYYMDAYGFNGILCRFRPKTSAYYDFFVYTPVEITGVFAIISIIGVAVVYCTLSKSMENARQAIKNIIIVLLTLLAYKIVFTVMKVVPRVLKAENSLTQLAVTRCFHTIGKFVLIVGYLLAFHFSKFCEPIRKLVKMSSDVKRREINYLKGRHKEYKTFRDSSRESAPSSTFFSIPYTGQFTDITKV